MIKKFNQYNESLLDKLEGPSERDALKENPTKVLLHAYDNNDLDLFRLALEHGANIEKKYSSKKFNNATLLYYVTYEGKEEMVKLLIEYGANIEKDTYVGLLAEYGSIDLIKYVLDRISLTYEQYKKILSSLFYVDDKKKEQLVDLINHYIYKNVTKDVSKPWKPYIGVHDKPINRFVKDYLDNMDESLLTKLEGPSEKELSDYLLTLDPEKALLKSIKIEYKDGIIDSLKRIEGDLDITLKYLKKMFEILDIDKNLKEINKIIKDIDLLYEYSYTFLFKDGLIYCYDKINKKDMYILEDVVFNGEDNAHNEDYERKKGDLFDCINILIDNGLDLKTISVQDLYFILDETNINKLENIFLDNMSSEQINEMLEIVTYEESQHHSLFSKILNKNPNQKSKNNALKKVSQYADDISDNNIYFYVSKLLENGAEPTLKLLKDVSKLKEGNRDNLKVYNLFKKYFDI